MFPAGSLLGNAAECVCRGGNFVACAAGEHQTDAAALPRSSLIF